MRIWGIILLCSSLIASCTNDSEKKDFTISIVEITTLSIVYHDGKIYINDIVVKCFCGQYATYITKNDKNITGYCEYHLAHLHRSDKNSPHRDTQ